MGVRDVLVDGVQDFLLHLADGITVQHLHLDLRAFLILRMDAVHHLWHTRTHTVCHCAERDTSFELEEIILLLVRRFSSYVQVCLFERDKHAGVDGVQCRNYTTLYYGSTLMHFTFIALIALWIVP